MAPPPSEAGVSVAEDGRRATRWRLLQIPRVLESPQGWPLAARARVRYVRACTCFCVCGELTLGFGRARLCAGKNVCDIEDAAGEADTSHAELLLCAATSKLS